jgi:hypothetical protein
MKGGTTMKSLNLDLIYKFYGDLDPEQDNRTLEEIRAEVILLGATDDEADELIGIIREMRA